MMSILLLGKDGQVGWQLQRSLAPHGEVIACGRPECDLSDLTGSFADPEIRGRPSSSMLQPIRRSIAPKPRRTWPCASMAKHPACWPRRRQHWVPCWFIIRPTTCSMAARLRHTFECDPTGPQSVYGRSKLAGEEAIRATGCKSRHIPHELGVRRARRQLRQDHPAPRPGKGVADVVGDQLGAPTPAALIATVTGIALAMLRKGKAMEHQEQRLYHLCSGRPVSWHEFATTIVELAGAMPGFDLRLAPGAIRAIPSSAYPTAAVRPPIPGSTAPAWKATSVCRCPTGNLTWRVCCSCSR
jgi:dTDP-4-dehydrorhamnose reductase